MNRSTHRQCRGKVTHSSERTAKLALHRTMETTAELGLLYYQCPHCRGWHIGHAPRGEQRRLRFRRLLSQIDKANRPNSSEQSQ